MQEIADFIAQHVEQVRFRDLPPEIVSRTKLAILDTMAACVAGNRSPGCQQVLNLALSWGGAEQATVVGTRARLPVPSAVLVNTMMARALDLDDVYEIGTTHPSVGVVPAALSVAEAEGRVSGQKLILAVAVGVDLSCRLARAIGLPPSVTGMSATFQGAVFGAAVAAGKILGLDREALRNAIGAAYTTVHGNQQCLYESTLMVRTEQGLASQSGVIAAYLARVGITGPRQVFEGRFGYFPAFQRGNYNRDAFLEGLGTEYLISEVSVKPYSCCKFIHTFIDSVLHIVRTHDVDPTEIDHIVAEVDSRLVYRLVCEPDDAKKRPTTVVESQFSLPYALAVAASRRTVTLHDFTEAALGDDEVLDLSTRVKTVLTDKAAEAADEGRSQLPVPGHVAIHMRSGRVFRHSVEFCKGHPRNPMSMEEVIEKFWKCAEFGLPRPNSIQGSKFVQLVSQLESVDDVSALASALSVNHSDSREELK